ncbi:FAD-dependent oxidoreductase [Salinisphaera sp. SPP-AMP-43]|uniref:FAD-dependent oxidoreductase n=1 Tax=Salinisphaera sp. SPP-AMP-43 TaxID=3121288 RepID=UPI003C6DEF95
MSPEETVAVRAPSCDRTEADAIVIGGGIYGLMIALEAGQAGYRVLLLERDTIGAATSANWFRILHGGLRYLQSLDFPRVLESIAERRWFLQFAPDLVRPMRFLMPLYGNGSRRPAMFRAAFMADAVLGMRRNAGLGPDQRLARGRVLDSAATLALCSGLQPEGLQGGALWYDAIADDSGQLMARIRRQVEATGGSVREGMAARDLLTEQGNVIGVWAGRCGQPAELFRAPVVINAAGPWSDRLAERFGLVSPNFFRPSLAFNLLLDIEPPAELGVAVSPPGATRPTLFVYPQGRQSFVGTWHARWPGAIDSPTVPEAEVAAFLETLNAALPVLQARRRDVVAIFPGLLPAQSMGGVEPAHHEVIHDYGAAGGPAGLFSVSGVKFTTARRVAEKLVRRLPARSR